jgi:hypothetical protein
VTNWLLFSGSGAVGWQCLSASAESWRRLSCMALRKGSAATACEGSPEVTTFEKVAKVSCGLCCACMYGGQLVLCRTLHGSC